MVVFAEDHDGLNEADLCRCQRHGGIDVDDVHGILFLQNGKKFFWLKRMTRLSAQDSAALGADRSAEE